MNVNEPSAFAFMDNIPLPIIKQKRVSMIERPILFNGEMVKAILDGRKTQTRRPVHKDLVGCITGKGENIVYRNPFGKTTDQLWVRETWTVNLTGDSKNGGLGTVPIYRAEHPNAFLKWKPSIHMPRWASRIDLFITDIRIERIQDISANDCHREGIEFSFGVDPHDEYRKLWDSIYKNWDENPWVWVIEFVKVEK